MPRATKQKIEINNSNSLQNIMQEVYNNACGMIQDAQKVINEVDSGSSPEDVDDWVKIAKAKTDALKLKDSAIKIKLDVGKLQSDIIKHNGDIAAAVGNNQEIVSKDSFARIREMVNNRDSKSE